MNDNKMMLRLTIKQDDLPSLPRNNAEVLTYLLQERNRGCKLAAWQKKAPDRGKATAKDWDDRDQTFDRRQCIYPISKNNVSQKNIIF